MIAFMVLNIICFVINGVASILIFIVIGIWAGVASELTTKCRYIGGYCVCTYDGKGYSYKGMTNCISTNCRAAGQGALGA